MSLVPLNDQQISALKNLSKKPFSLQFLSRILRNRQILLRHICQPNRCVPLTFVIRQLRGSKALIPQLISWPPGRCSFSAFERIEHWTAGRNCDEEVWTFQRARRCRQRWFVKKCGPRWRELNVCERQLFPVHCGCAVSAYRLDLLILLTQFKVFSILDFNWTFLLHPSSIEVVVLVLAVQNTHNFIDPRVLPTFKILVHRISDWLSLPKLSKIPGFQVTGAKS